MCGIIGVVGRSPVNQLLYDGLQVLQHRGQDAAGIVTADGDTFRMHKARGLVRDVFRTRDMRSLVGHAGVGHCRYPTAGDAWSLAEAQPFYVNSPFGIVLAHNGNLINADQLKAELFRADLRHVNTNSDSEVLLNVFAHELQDRVSGTCLDNGHIFDAVAEVHRRCQGAYAVVAMIAGHGLLAFRDPYGIRPLVLGRADTAGGPEWLVASESVALDVLGFGAVDDVAPGEAVIVTFDGRIERRQCAETPRHSPCLFEYVYMARPDSVIDGISVYDARLRMGEALAEKVRQTCADIDIDVVIPIPESSRPSALQLANALGLSYREGFIKNRYIGRTFIMPGQAQRRKSVRQKLNAIGIEFRGRNVLLVDDSIVRGTTSREIVQMARDAGARKVIFASAAPPVRYPNVYGIDMPTRGELIATGRNDEEIAREIGADRVVYQDVDAIIAAVAGCHPGIGEFDASCFTGEYVTGNVTAAYLAAIENHRGLQSGEGRGHRQLDLNLTWS